MGRSGKNNNAHAVDNRKNVKQHTNNRRTYKVWSQRDKRSLKKILRGIKRTEPYKKHKLSKRDVVNEVIHRWKKKFSTSPPHSLLGVKSQIDRLR